jgi:hypothetical protein
MNFSLSIDGRAEAVVEAVLDFFALFRISEDMVVVEVDENSSGMHKWRLDIIFQ